MRGLLQFTLDLFGESGVLSCTPTPKPARGREKSRAPQPPAGSLASPFDATRPALGEPLVGPALPPLAPSDAIVPAAFTHPRATRDIQLGRARVAYEFMRCQRRTIGFLIGAEGLTVRAPRWVALRDVDAALQEKADWILRKLDESQERHARQAAARIAWKDGASFPYLGETVTIQLDPRHDFQSIGAIFDGGAESTPRILHVALGHDAQVTQIRDAVQAWLMRQARQLFTERLDHFAPRLGVVWRKLALSNATTRWGSASTNGSIRLHWRLIHLRLPVIDYVVVHELSHLRVMNHSPHFWKIVESVIPNYAQLRHQLKNEIYS